MRSGSAYCRARTLSGAVLCSERTAQESATLVEPSTTALSTFDAVVLVDVPALEIDSALLDPAHSPLVSYVDDGGELVVIGGSDSYGVVPQPQPHARTSGGAQMGEDEEGAGHWY